MKFLWAMEKHGLRESVATWGHNWLENCVEGQPVFSPQTGSGLGLLRAFLSDFYLQHQSVRACKSAFLENLEKAEINLFIRTNIRLFYELGKMNIASTSWGMSKVALWESSRRWQWVPQGEWASSILSKKSEIRLGCINQVFLRHLTWSCCTYKVLAWALNPTWGSAFQVVVLGESPGNNKIRNAENMTYWRRLKDQGSLVSRRLQGNKIKVLKCIKPCYKVRDNGLILIFRVGRGRSHRLNLQWLR